MRSSSWHAHGNVYLVMEPCGLTPERVRELVGSADGILEVSADGEVVIWNPDGSQAEMSGNGTRIAARWLARRANADEVRIAVGPREVSATILGPLEVEMDMGAVEVQPIEELDVDGTRL